MLYVLDYVRRKKKESMFSFFVVVVFVFRVSVCVSFSSRYFRFCWLCSMVAITSETTVAQSTENECFYWMSCHRSTNRWRLPQSWLFFGVWENISARNHLLFHFDHWRSRRSYRTKKKLRLTAKKYICMEFCVWRHDTIFTLITTTSPLTTDCLTTGWHTVQVTCIRNSDIQDMFCNCCRKHLILLRFDMNNE